MLGWDIRHYQSHRSCIILYVDSQNGYQQYNQANIEMILVPTNLKY